MREAVQRIVVVTVLGSTIGVLVGVAAIGFVTLVFWLNDVLFVSPRSRMLVADNPWLPLMTVAVPVAGGLIVGMLGQSIRECRPHALADVIQATHLTNAPLRLKAGLKTALAAVLSLGCGASVGQYGPLAHLGATLGALCGRVAGERYDLGGIAIGCGTAAAIATAFNAPLAGLVFAHEVILRHYSLRAFAPVSVSASIGYVVAVIVFDRPPLFLIEQLRIVSPFEFFGFILIGISGALIATLFMHLLLACNRLAARLPIGALWHPALAGLVVGLVALPLPEILGVGKELLRFAIIDQAFSSGEIMILVTAKIVLTSLCLGFGFAGGVFSPCLLIGILFGALVGMFADHLFADAVSPVAIYAICGMVAVTGPVIGAPLTTILIVFELTGNYALAMAAMVSVAFANLIAYRLFGRSLFDVQLRNRGIDLEFGRDRIQAQQRRVRELISNDVVRVGGESRLEAVEQALLSAARHEALVCAENQRFIGTITLCRLAAERTRDAAALSQIRAGDFAVEPAACLDPDDTLREAMYKLRNFVGECIPVVESGRLCGVVFEATIIDAYLDTLADVRREEHAAL